jgi:hypothetical protein
MRMEEGWFIGLCDVPPANAIRFIATRQHYATNHEQLSLPPPKQPEQTDQFQESHRTVHIPRTVLEARRCGSVDWSRSSVDSFHPVPNLPHPTGSSGDPYGRSE